MLGIDIGTGSTKAVALDAQQQVVATAQQHYALLPAAPGLAAQSVQQVWEAVVYCLGAVAAQMGRPPALVGLSACMHSLLAVDAAGQPITDMITWADARSQPVAAELRQWAGAADLYKATGTPLHAMSPLCKIIWYRQKEKETFAKAARWLSIKEYIWWRLFGSYEVDVSIAAASGLMDIHQFDWYAPALQLAQIRPAQLSAIKPVTYTRSDLCKEARAVLPGHTEAAFCIGSSDGCMANMGSDALQKGVGALTIGTSGAVRVATARPVSDSSAMLFSYPIDERTFICGGPVNNGGNAVHWALKKLKQLPAPDEKDYETFYGQVDSVPPGSEGLLCLPYFSGERAPVWDARSSGAFVGVKAHHTQAHFFRATMEGVCFALYQVLQQVEGATGAVELLHVSGGFIRSAVWLQMLADITGKKLGIVTEEDASATGAALLAMSAGGWAVQQGGSPKQMQVIDPGPQQHALYQSYFDIYTTLYPSLQNAMHQLHQLQQNT